MAGPDRTGPPTPAHALGPVEALREIGFWLERQRAETYRVKAYRRAADAVAALDEAEFATRPARDLVGGDLRTRSDWSGGGSPIEEMLRVAAALGHRYCALTDHSPRLTVANGLSADRLRRQLDVVAELNEQLAPFRILTGIEVDILDDGSLDQRADLLAELDIVVASVHSHLRADSAAMTQRMVYAVADPNVDVLGHCTGRLVTGGRGTRPE